MIQKIFVMHAVILYLTLAPGTASAQHSDVAPASGPGSPCHVIPEPRTVQGTSLEPLIHQGQAITLLRGYYDCHPLKRNDVVAYRYTGKADPVIKMVKGLAGDTFALQQTPVGGWQIMINGEIVTTSAGIPYTLDERRARMLASYARSYQGVIPAHSCLLLGNLPQGSLDSTRFGLIDQGDLIGKVASL